MFCSVTFGWPLPGRGKCGATWIVFWLLMACGGWVFDYLCAHPPSSFRPPGASSGLCCMCWFAGSLRRGVSCHLRRLPIELWVHFGELEWLRQVVAEANCYLLPGTSSFKAFQTGEPLLLTSLMCALLCSAQVNLAGHCQQGASEVPPGLYFGY